MNGEAIFRGRCSTPARAPATAAARGGWGSRWWSWPLAACIACGCVSRPQYDSRWGDLATERGENRLLYAERAAGRAKREQDFWTGVTVVSVVSCLIGLVGYMSDEEEFSKGWGSAFLIPAFGGLAGSLACGTSPMAQGE